MAKERSGALTEDQKAQLAALRALPEEEIDTSEIPEVRDWSGWKRGLFYRPPQPEAAPRIRRRETG